MTYIYVTLIAGLLYLFAKLVEEYLKIPPLICYLISGLIFGITNFDFMQLNGNAISFNSATPSLSLFAVYNKQIALSLMFVAVAFSIDLTKIKWREHVSLKLATVPVYVEGFIIGLLIYAISSNWPTPVTNPINIFDSFFIGVLLSMSTAVVIFPITGKNISEGRYSRNNINEQLRTVTVLDIYTALAAVIVMFTFASEVHMYGKVQATVIASLAQIFSLITITSIVSYYGAVLLSKILKAINLIPIVNKAFLVLVTLNFLVVLSKLPLNLNGLNAFAYGLGLNHAYKMEDRESAIELFNGALNYFAYPIIFFYLGLTTDLKQLFDIVSLELALLILIVGIIVKGLSTYIILKRKEFDKNEAIFGALCSIPKGNGVVNFGVIMLGQMMVENNMDGSMNLIKFFAVFDILVSIPIGIFILERARKRLFPVTQTD